MSTLPRFIVDMLPRSLVVDPPMSDAEFEAFCLQNDTAHLERTAEGVIRINAPTGMDTACANSEINGRLFIWWSKHQRGQVVADSSGGFYLPDSSILSPDAAYMLSKTQKQKTGKKRTAFFPVCPDFVVELLSKSDPIEKTEEKMERWIANGLQLGWLIDPYQKKVFIYQPGAEVSAFAGKILKGIGPVKGFNLDLSRIWRYYEE